MHNRNSHNSAHYLVHGMLHKSVYTELGTV